MNIPNEKLLGKIITIFDTLIRFLYCRIPLRRLVFWKIYSSKPELQLKRYEKMNDMCKDNNIDIREKKCLELGPGNSRVIALSLIHEGVKEVNQLDKFNRRMKTKKQIKYEKYEEQFVLTKFNNSNKQLNTDKLNFMLGDLETVKLKDSSDFIFSVSVLEHVKNVESFIKSTRVCLKKGGYMWHHIDLRDHYNFMTPFLFYKYDDENWNKWLVKEGISYTNRLRIDDFRKIFKNNGFRIVSEYTQKEEIPTNINISSSLSNKPLDILEITQVDILLEAI